MKPLFFALASLALGAQDSHSSPYAGQQARTLKALSDSEISAYRSGGGMGLAKPAELNGYPGPRHVLDLKREIGLTDNQVRAIQHLFEGMKKEATQLGSQIVLLETELDSIFSGSMASWPRAKELTLEIGELQARYRWAHLKAHQPMRGILSPEQIHRYNALRGNSSPPPSPGQGRPDH